MKILPAFASASRRFAALLGATLALAGAPAPASAAPVSPTPAAEKQLYTCSMHPGVIKDAPGACPICGMNLTPIRPNAFATPTGPAAAPTGPRKIKYYQSTMIPGQVSPTPAKDTMGMDMVPVYEDAAAGAPATDTIQIDARTLQRMNLKTAPVTRGPVRRELRAVATVAFNERGLRDITTKYEGWIERLHVNAIWTPVHAGDLLFEIYSPDLYNAQLNYLVALRAEGDAGGPLTRASLARLQLFDLAPEFLAELTRTGTAQRTYPYRAPASGYVIEKMAVEGQMTRSGEKLLRLADLSTVWILAQIYEQDLPFVHDGQPATVRLTYGATSDYPATVDMVVPQVEAQTRTAVARLVLANPGEALRPGMFAEVRLTTELAADAVLVPDVAVLRSGERNTVFLALPDGGFAPREVRLGARSEGNFYQVLSGLAAGDRVVTSGQFMLDSESQLREAIQKMLQSAEGTPAANAPATPAPANERKILRYQSSMMPAETSPTPAKDSMGMEMVPVYEATAGGTEAPDPGPDHPDHAGHDHRGHDHGAPPPATPAPATPRAAAGDATLLPLALAAADAAAALAQDDLAGYRQALPALRSALATHLRDEPHAAHGPLARFAGQLVEPADLAAARQVFEPFSTDLTDLARARHLPQRAGLRAFECSMSPQLGAGRWLQRGATAANPFFGSAMPLCGDELDVAPPAPPAGTGGSAALPAGHPPLAVADYLRRLPAASARPLAPETGGNCGGCGMSAAAMAAGAPCPPTTAP